MFPITYGRTFFNLPPIRRPKGLLDHFKNLPVHSLRIMIIQSLPYSSQVSFDANPTYRQYFL